MRTEPGRLNHSTQTWAWLCQSLGLFGACAEPWLHLRSLSLQSNYSTQMRKCEILGWGRGDTVDWISCWVISSAALVLSTISHFSTNVWINPFLFVLCSVLFWCLRLPVFLAGSSLTWPSLLVSECFWLQTWLPSVYFKVKWFLMLIGVRETEREFKNSYWIFISILSAFGETGMKRFQKGFEKVSNFCCEALCCASLTIVTEGVRSVGPVKAPNTFICTRFRSYFLLV